MMDHNGAALPSSLTEVLSGLNPPTWMNPDNCVAIIGGSHLAQVQHEDSDVDVYGYFYPPEELIFPDKGGHVPGFDRDFAPYVRFKTPESIAEPLPVEVHFTSVGLFCSELTGGSPKHLPLLFSGAEHRITTDDLFDKLTDIREQFVTVQLIAKYVGSAVSAMEQVDKLKRPVSQLRAHRFDRDGYDTKTMMQAVRLLSEAKQLITHRALDFASNRELLIGIRDGAATLRDARRLFQSLQADVSRLRTEVPLSSLKPNQEVRGLLRAALWARYARPEFAQLTPDAAPSCGPR